MGQAPRYLQRVQRRGKQNLSSHRLLRNRQTRSQFYYNMESTVVKLYNRVLESKNGFSETCWSPCVLEKSPTRVTLSIGKAKLSNGKVYWGVRCSCYKCAYV